MPSSNFQNWLVSRRSPEFRARMEKRTVIMGEVRRFFRNRGFLECETPIMVRLPGMEPNLEPIRASVRPQDGVSREAWLITSPEYSLKKILAAGYGPIFEITRAFRDGEPWSGAHNPEFTMLEWYRPHADYRAIMDDTEEMVAAVATAVTGSPRVTYQGRPLDFSPGWERLTVAEAMSRHAGIDLARGIDDPEWFASEVRARGLDVPAGESFDDTFFRVFLRDVEPKLGIGRPVFLYDYPRSMASLARFKEDDPRFAERVEAYAGGLELANGFSELTDAAEQRRRLMIEREERTRLGRHDFALDEAFLAAVGEMPAAAGIAFGLDRLVMLLTDAPSIREVLFFPAAALFGSEDEESYKPPTTKH